AKTAARTPGVQVREVLEERDFFENILRYRPKSRLLSFAAFSFSLSHLHDHFVGSHPAFAYGLVRIGHHFLKSGIACNFIDACWKKTWQRSRQKSDVEAERHQAWRRDRSDRRHLRTVHRTIQSVALDRRSEER